MSEIEQTIKCLKEEGWKHYPGDIEYGSETHNFIREQSILQLILTEDADEDFIEEVKRTA